MDPLKQQALTLSILSIVGVLVTIVLYASGNGYVLPLLVTIILLVVTVRAFIKLR